MNSRPYSTPPLGRTSWWRKLAAFGAALALFGGTASAQCTNGISYSSTVAPAPSGTTTLPGCTYTVEYNLLSGVTAGHQYVITQQTGNSAWVTVRSGTPGGPVVGFGAYPLTWTALVGGDHYVHINLSAACNGENSCNNNSITNNGPQIGCTGTPSSGSVPASFSACANSPVAITMSGFTTGVTGITFSWQESDDNGGGDPWGPVVGGSGATTSTYTTPGFSGVRYYRGIATCSNSGFSGPPTNASMVSQTGNCQFTVARNTGVSYQTIVGNGGLDYPGFLFGSTSTDDATTNTVPLTGTTFQYKGQPVAGLRACTNGWLSFDPTITAATYINSLGGADKAVLAPFWDDLVCTGNPFTAAGQNASMQYKIDGVLGSGTAKIICEWIGMEKFGNPGPNLNYQVILDEVGNTITFRYGTMEGFSGSQNTLWDTSIGLNGWAFTTPASFSDVMALRDENTTNFDFTPAVTANAGLNYLVRAPDCNTEYVFTPAAAYPGPGVAPTAPPANDEFAGAISLTVGTLPCTALCGTYYNSQFATASAGIPVCGAVTPGTPDDDVWFSFIPNQANTNIQVRSGASHDAVVQLLDATATTSIACVNLGAVGTIETLNAIGLTTGTPYLIRVYNAGLGLPISSRNDFSICVYDAPPPPANDDCAGAISLPVGLTCSPVAGSSLTATPSVQALCTGTPDDDVWYSFVAPGNGATIRVQSVGTYNAALQVFSSTTNDCNNLVSIACVNSTSTGALETVTLSGLTTGNTYRVRVYHAAAGTANGSFTICAEAGPVCPVLSSPANGGTVATLPVALSWAPGQFAATYDVYFDQNLVPTTLVSANQVGTTFNVNSPGPNGLYYWRVVSKNVLGDATGCTAFSVNVNIPPCQQPSLVSVTPAPTSASVSWQCFGCIGTYIVEYGAPGFIPGTGAAAGAGTILTTGLTSATILGLATGTPYQLYVRQECNPSIEYSLNTGPISFTTALSCGSVFQDIAGAGFYPANLQASPDIRTICPTTAGDKVIVQFTEFRSENTYDPLYVFDGASTAATKIASTNGNSNSFPDPYQPGGWWNSTTPSTGTAAIAAAPQNTGIPGIVIATNPSGCLTFAHLTDTSVEYEGWTASVSCATPHYDCTTAGTIQCGAPQTGFTFGGTNTLPVNGCGFNGGASTSGVSWWVYNALATEDITVTTCGTTTMDTRISVYKAMPDCNNLVCVGAVDDGPGCPNGSSDMLFKADAGQTYYIAIHGNAANNGLFQVGLFCQPVCNLDPNDNDNCGSALAITSQLNDGNQVLTLDNNSCSYVDGPTSCAGALPSVGNWYSFAANGSTSHRVYVVDNTVNNAFTAQSMNYALFSGNCTDLLATGPVDCHVGSGFTQLPPLSPTGNYKLFVYNSGGQTQRGTFGVWVDRPPLNDASVTAVTAPSGLLCDTVQSPVITLLNNGAATLTSVLLDVSVDLSPTITSYAWTGSLATGASVQVVLPLMNIPSGNHSLVVTARNPNGAPDEIPSNSASSVLYEARGNGAVLTVRTGPNGSQCSWLIQDFFSQTLASGGPYTGQNNATIATTVCLDDLNGDCYFMYVYDASGDGLLNAANWELRDRRGRLVLADNGAFVGQSPSTSPTTAGYFAHEFCLPLGPSPILASECNLFSNFLNNKVYTTAVPGTLDYQFEFSDPNAGYRRRIKVPRTYVQFSEVTGLSFGVTYFVRVRADVGGNGVFDDFFGAGCEMALSASQPICTELISTPGINFSCGATKAFGGSDKIYAQPVSGATQYRFNFSNAGLGFSRTIVRPSYVCLLSWVSLPLVSGNTYQVKVETYRNGAWQGYCGAICPLNIQNPPANGANQGRMQEAAMESAVQMWPNPVGDGRVNLLISDLNEEIEHVTVDVYDVFGKLVMSEAPVVSGTTFSHLLNLDKGMAAGIYTVNITINDQVFTQRLSVQ